MSIHRVTKHFELKLNWLIWIFSLEQSICCNTIWWNAVAYSGKTDFILVAFSLPLKPVCWAIKDMSYLMKWLPLARPIPLFRAIKVIIKFPVYGPLLKQVSLSNLKIRKYMANVYFWCKVSFCLVCSHSDLKEQDFVDEVEVRHGLFVVWSERISFW